jgi:V/A-type H+-transporting ATPase subunit I
MSCAFEVRDPTPEEYPNVPVQLKNGTLSKPLNMVTEMYSLPAYGSLDPNPLMAPFFILFYGIMMADMGYGILMILMGAIVLKKKKPTGTFGYMCGLLVLCGISTFIMGALTGGFFGDFIPQLLKLINPNSTFELPSLFTPLEDTMMILVGALCLGFIQIIVGMAISFYKKLRDGQVLDAIFEEVTWWVVFLGLALAILGVTNVVLIIGGVLVVAGPLITGKGFVGKVFGIFGSLYNHITGYFGDVLSYSRLMALMLAGSVIAQVFNTLGAIPGNIIIFLVISLAGNALNFALNILSCYVHDLRLQCLEYFGKFYEDGGKPFRPLNLNTKYYDVVK